MDYDFFEPTFDLKKRIGKYLVSTVDLYFFQIDSRLRKHNFKYETLILNKNFTDIYCDRYLTCDEAIKGHKKAIKWLKKKIKEGKL